MRYFRTYPYMLQLILLVLMLFTFMSVATLFILLILTHTTGLTFGDLTNIGTHTAQSTIIAMEWVQGASNLFTFCIPALLFAYLATPYPASYLGLRTPGKKIQLLLAVLIMVGAAPVLSGLESLIGQINFSADIKSAQKTNDDLLTTIMNVNSFPAFVRTFVLFAIVPGIGEELFFRGVLMRFARKRSRNMVFPILFSAAVFAGVHANVYGMLSIFTAGIFLAIIYNLTGSIWCGVLGHMFFNGLQIILSYIGHSYTGVKAVTEGNTVPIYLVIGGLIVCGGSFYLLWKNRTPLPKNWTDDFTPEELSPKAH